MKVRANPLLSKVNRPFFFNCLVLKYIKTATFGVDWCSFFVLQIIYKPSKIIIRKYN
jgi:hypothetical protein